MVEETVIEGFSVEKLFGDVGWKIQLLGSEEIEEDREAIWVPINEVVFIGGGVGEFLEVPVLVEHRSEDGVTAGVCERRRCRFEDSASDVESHPVFLNSHG